MGAGKCYVELPVVAAHGVWKTAARQVSRGEELGRRPLGITITRENAIRFWAAANIQFSLVACDAVYGGVVAGLTTFFPLISAKIFVNSTWIVVTGLQASPVDRRCHRVELATMDDERSNAFNFASAHLPTICPSLATFVTVDAAPILWILSTRSGRVEPAFVNGE